MRSGPECWGPEALLLRTRGSTEPELVAALRHEYPAPSIDWVLYSFQRENRKTQRGRLGYGGIFSDPRCEGC